MYESGHMTEKLFTVLVTRIRYKGKGIELYSLNFMTHSHFQKNKPSCCDTIRGCKTQYDCNETVVVILTALCGGVVTS